MICDRIYKLSENTSWICYIDGDDYVFMYDFIKKKEFLVDNLNTSSKYLNERFKDPDLVISEFLKVLRQ